jgi:hypothetical protein
MKTQTNLSQAAIRSIRPSCQAAQILAVLVASFGTGWFSPPLAHSQNAMDWNRAWCNAIANCPSFYRQHTGRARPTTSARMFRAGYFSALGAVPRSGFPFAFGPQRVFGVSNGSIAPPLHLGSPFMVSRPNPNITNDNWTGGAGNWSNASMWTAGVPAQVDEFVMRELVVIVVLWFVLRGQPNRNCQR